MNAPALIQCRGITKRFGRTTVLRDVDVSIGGGQVVGIVGENGSGKSTLLQILAGILSATSGSVERHGSIGYCPQDALVFEALTVIENLRFFGAAVGVTGPLFEERSERLLASFGLTEHRSHVVSQLSGGSKQKLNLVVALLDDPAVLLLDEPCSGLDWDTYLTFWALANQARGAGKRGLREIDEVGSASGAEESGRAGSRASGAPRCRRPPGYDRSWLTPPTPER